MSGFVALFDRGGAGNTREDLDSMLDSIDHRGPDGSGTWFDEEIALGHQQLQSTPESQFDDQPYRDEELAVVGDVRLDNRDELLENLDISGESYRIPDSHLLLAAYRRWGKHCPERLIGSFAFVIWDMDEETVFCVRDRFGVKPLYYHQSDGVFLVASEKKAILRHPLVSNAINELKIAGFLTKTFNDARASFFEDIERLPPARTRTVDVDSSREQQYWSLDPTRTIQLDSDAAYERRFRGLFEQAVRCRLRSSGPIGTDLSGGLDSSSVTVVARDQLSPDQDLHTFSNIYDDSPTANERSYIETITDRDGISSHYIFPDETNALVDADDLFTYFDEPPHNDMHFAKWERVKKASNTGVGVVLGGELGDQTIGYGLSYLPELFLTGRWWTLWKEIHAMGDLLDVPASRMFKMHVLSHVVPNRLQRFRQRLKGNKILLELANPMLNPDFVERHNLRAWYKKQNTDRLGVVWNDRRDHYKALSNSRISAAFESADLINAAFGIEHRYPFTDKRLVEFCLAIPPDQKFAEGWTRSIVRRTLGRLLPQEIQWRPWKTRLNEASHKSLSREERRFEILLNNPGQLTNYLNMDAVEEQYNQFRAAENPDLRIARSLWKVLSLFVWLTEYGGGGTEHVTQAQIIEPSLDSNSKDR